MFARIFFIAGSKFWLWTGAKQECCSLSLGWSGQATRCEAIQDNKQCQSVNKRILMCCLNACRDLSVTFNRVENKHTARVVRHANPALPGQGNVLSTGMEHHGSRSRSTSTETAGWGEGRQTSSLLNSCPERRERRLQAHFKIIVYGVKPLACGHAGRREVFIARRWGYHLPYASPRSTCIFYPQFINLN